MPGDNESVRSAMNIVDIVASFAGREAATVEDILKLAQQLPRALGLAAQSQDPSCSSAQAPEKDVVPAVPIDESVSKDAITCLCCGKSFVMLKRHLKAEHDLTEQEYRRLFELADDYPLVAPSYSERKAAYAKKIGLGKYVRDEA